MPSIKLASSTLNAITAALATAAQRTPAGAAQLSLDALPRTPFLELKKRQLQSADFWYHFALTRPLVDVRWGVPVHLLATNVLSSPEDSISTRRLIQQLKPSAVLLQHTPELWNDVHRNNEKLARLKAFIRVVAPCAEAAQAPFPSCQADIHGRCNDEEAYSACVKEEEERLQRFYAGLAEAERKSRLLRPEFVMACRQDGNIAKWESFVAFLETHEHGIDLKAIDMPIAYSAMHTERERDAWEEVLAQPPEEKLLPIARELAEAADLQIGDLLHMARYFDKPSMLRTMGRAAGCTNLFPLPKIKERLSIDRSLLYGTVGLRGLRAVNACLSSAETGHPRARAVAAVAEEYLAYALWREIGDRHEAGSPPRTSSSAQNKRYEQLYPVKKPAAARIFKALFPADTRRGAMWKSIGELGGDIENTNFVVPAVPHHFEGRFVPPAPQATLSSRSMLFIVDREHVPGIIRYWKRLNAAVPMEDRFDSHLLPRTLPASSDKSDVPKTEVPVE